MYTAVPERKNNRIIRGCTERPPCNAGPFDKPEEIVILIEFVYDNTQSLIKNQKADNRWKVKNKRVLSAAFWHAHLEVGPKPNNEIRRAFSFYNMYAYRGVS